MSDSCDHEKAMAFVLCRSEGGPYDDDAFVAGFECGAVDRALELCEGPTGHHHSGTFHTATVPQLDLIAMRHGFVLSVTDDDGHWADIRLTRSARMAL